MSKAQELAERMKASNEKEASSKAELERQVSEWPGHVDRLNNMIVSWISPLTAHGMKVVTLPCQKFECEMNVQSHFLEILYQDKILRTDPTWFVTGSEGVVAFSDGFQTFLKDGDWYVRTHPKPVTPDHFHQKQLLDEDLFLDYIQRYFKI